MIINIKELKKIISEIVLLIFSIILIILGFKLAYFYMPFVITFLIYLLIEPIIKFFMRKFNLKRKTSSLLILTIIISIIVGFLIFGIITIISESSNLLKNLNEYVTIIQKFITEKSTKFDINKLQLSPEIMTIFNNSSTNLVTHISNLLKIFLTNILEKLTSLPTVGFYIIITIMSLYFISTDKIYMIDQLEHHLPRKWVKIIAKHIREISKSLGGYLKAELILILISFIISLIGLYFFKFIGLNIPYPFLAALGIGFIDALPILGSGTVMIPWSIISACKGDLKLGLSIFILWIIMSIVRQIIEPKIVSGKLGIHPIFTIIAMYTGFRFCGVIGLFVGPIILIILKNIFENRIDKGLINSIIES